MAKKRVPFTKTQTINDWCHRCGERKNQTFIEFVIPINAEHSLDTRDRYNRICATCIKEFSLLIQAEHAGS